MTADALLARLWEVGYRVELTPDGPRLVKQLHGAVLPPNLLADLKANRDAVVRYLTPPEPDPPPSAGPCPWCGKPMRAGVYSPQCWHCGRRACVVCGRDSGSVFIATCLTCGLAMPDGET